MSVSMSMMSLLTVVQLPASFVMAAPPDLVGMSVSGAVAMFSPLQQASFLREIFRHLMNTDTDGSTVAENTADIARAAGYYTEEHFVETADGYILTLHHIPPQANPKRRSDATQDILNEIYSSTTSSSIIDDDDDDISRDSGYSDSDTETTERLVSEPPVIPTKSAPSPYSINGLVNNVLGFFTFGDDSKEENRNKRQIPTLNEVPDEVPDEIFIHRPSDIGRGVIFLQHGLMGSSDNWVTNNEKDCLAYLLSDAGYDVWMGNFRGNIYSRNHTRLTHNDPEFWSFSFDEMAKYDLPAMLNYVLEKTNVEKVQYIGHSMGTTTFFALMSSQPSYQDKVSSMIALAPVATVASIQSPIKYLAPLVKEIAFLLRMFGSEQNMMTNRMMISLWDPYNVCNNHEFCENLQFIITGFDPDRADPKMRPMILSHSPAGASTKTLFHFAQGYDSGNFSMYDHGVIENLRRYSQEKPPLYDVSKINLPITLFHGKGDWLTGFKDIVRLENSLPNLQGSYQILNPSFSHLDFLWATDARTLVYDKVLDIVNR